MRRRLLALVFALVAGMQLRAQLQLDVRWQLPPQGLAYGDAFEVAVERRWPAGAAAAPFDPAALQPLAIVPLAVEALADGERRRYRAFAYASGELQLPPIALRVQTRDGRALTTTCTPPPLVVRSSLEDPAGDVEWPDVLAAPTSHRLLPWLAVFACALVAAMWWRRQRSRPAAVAAPMAPSPAAMALAALAALVEPAAAAPASAVAAFYRQLAAIVRDHAGRNLPVAAATRTSEELFAVARAATAELRACLGACDGVKFAARRPGAAAHAAARQAAIAFVRAEAV